MESVLVGLRELADDESLDTWRVEGLQLILLPLWKYPQSNMTPNPIKMFWIPFCCIGVTPPPSPAVHVVFLTSAAGWCGVPQSLFRACDPRVAFHRMEAIETAVGDDCTLSVAAILHVLTLESAVGGVEVCTNCQVWGKTKWVCADYGDKPICYYPTHYHSTFTQG